MKSDSKTRCDAADVGRAVAAAGRAAGWLLCRRCGQLGVPADGSHPCVHCTRFAIAEPKSQEGQRDQRSG